jgi:hypothetical protein
MNSAGFNAIARDYLRLGLMMLRLGVADGRQVVPESWVRESTVNRISRRDEELGELGYGYQWWTVRSSSAYLAIGLQGQYIFVDPDTDTVIVKLSYFPPNPDPKLESEALSFFKATSEWNPQ